MSNKNPFNFNTDFDPIIMQSKTALSYIDYMNDFQKEVSDFLKLNDFFLSFLYPYVKDHMDLISQFSVQGFDQSDALLESKKIVCKSIDTICDTIKNKDFFSNGDMKNFDLDRTPFISN